MKNWWTGDKTTGTDTKNTHWRDRELSVQKEIRKIREKKRDTERGGKVIRKRKEKDEEEGKLDRID
ncbi:hypothetical protein MJO28_001725 [Puccinia striiformis f. sp. tritici]|uniref:Uncharacterized protein n=1 Tax=Puccinia striiformis f. sp. tritici TaxID=168172 RepID=A0ACC0EVW5_9BASI|nr:hypothetical protein MJO28_001725 [Puccinia striiformis f. sp. tritici]